MGICHDISSINRTNNVIRINLAISKNFILSKNNTYQFERYDKYIIKI